MVLNLVRFKTSTMTTCRGPRGGKVFHNLFNFVLIILMHMVSCVVFMVILQTWLVDLGETKPEVGM